MSRDRAVEICKNLKYTMDNYVPSFELKVSEQWDTKKVKKEVLKKRYKELMVKYEIKLNELK